MMNVGIVFYAALETGDRRLRDIATRHVLTTRRYLIRGDGSTAQEGIFNLEAGSFERHTTHQGYRPDSCWSRGLAWALYGFGACYEATRDPRMLDTAQSCADYYLTHTNPDGVPPWDFQAPPETRNQVDTSAAAVAASGLLRLCRMLPDPVSLLLGCALHPAHPVRTPHSLLQRELEGILSGGCYHLPKNSAWKARRDYFSAKPSKRATKLPVAG